MASPRMLSVFLPAIFFLSGCAALIFENLWFYQAGLAFGNSIWASSLVLAGFMGGLALGNALAARLRPGRFRAIRLYGLLEVAIAVSGLALVVALPAIASLLATLMAPLLDSVWLVNPVRLGCAFVLLLIPSTAMGATLPVMVSALYERDPRFGSVLGRLYGWNTVGAVVGALAGDLVLIEALGVRGTGVAAAAIGLTAAGLAFMLSRRFEETPAGKEALAPHEKPERLTARALWLLAAAAMAGFTLLGLEVVWFRFLLHFMFGSSQTFAILLATVLAGIGLGGLIGGVLAASEARAWQLLPSAALLTGIASLGLYWAFPAGAPDYTWGPTLVRALVLMFPPALLSGALFTLVGAALKTEIASETRAAGLLTLANTTGATLGPLLAGFVLLPTLGMDRSVELLSAMYLVVGVVTLAAGARPKGALHRTVSGASALALVAMLLLFPGATMLERHLAPVLEPFTKGQNAEVIAMREGVTETIVYTEERVFGEPVSHRLITNGYSMSGTAIEGLRYMKLFVYLPMAIHPDAKSALLISYGVGTTAKALTNTPGFESIDVVDISRDILEMNDIVYPDEEEHPLHDPRVEVHVEDGRYFLETTDERFDLITGEPPPPKMAGIVTLYTREYFELVYDRLREGGIASYWLPVHTLSPSDSKAVVRAFCDAFEDCTLWGGAGLNWMLLGTKNATGPGSSERFARQWNIPAVRDDLELIAIERPEQLGALFMAGPDDLAELAGDAKPLTDDHPKRLSDAPFDKVAGVSSYRPWMDEAEKKRRFEESAWIEKVWPKPLRDATMSYFLAQTEINRTIVEKPPLDLQKVLQKVHVILVRTELETMPLWLLRSDGLRQEAAQEALDKGKESVAIHGELGLGSLALRDFEEAKRHLTQAAQLGAEGPQYAAATVYAVFMAASAEEKPEIIARLKQALAAGKPVVEPWVIVFLEKALVYQ